MEKMMVKMMENYGTPEKYCFVTSSNYWTTILKIIFQYVVYLFGGYYKLCAYVDLFDGNNHNLQRWISHIPCSILPCGAPILDSCGVFNIV